MPGSEENAKWVLISCPGVTVFTDINALPNYQSDEVKQEKGKDNGPSNKFHNLIVSSLFLSHKILAQNMAPSVLRCHSLLSIHKNLCFLDFYVSFS